MSHRAGPGGLYGGSVAPTSFRLAMLRNGDEQHFPEDIVKMLQLEGGTCLRGIRGKNAGVWPGVIARLYAGSGLSGAYLSSAAHRATLDAAGAGPEALERKKAFRKLEVVRLVLGVSVPITTWKTVKQDYPRGNPLLWTLQKQLARLCLLEVNPDRAPRNQRRT